MQGFFVTGTDTGVGKTLASLGLCLFFKADYWKPIQTGSPTDQDWIRPFLEDQKIHPSSYELKAPLSPNQAAQKENQSIDLKKIQKPKSSCLIVEGLGGALVPLNENQTQLDLMKQIDLPLIVVARSGLGTLNHSLLTLKVLKSEALKVKGLILSGPLNPLNKKDLEKWGDVPILLEIPQLSKVTKPELLKLFKNFSSHL
ncbi:MAG: dethiobiotin synthase [Bdellovibrionales bacterium]